MLTQLRSGELHYGLITPRALVDKVLQGHGTVMDSNVSPVSWAFNPEVPKFGYDPAKAKSLLDEAGWMAGGDGVRAKAGQKISFNVMIYNYDATLKQSLLAVQQNLKDVGVEMQI